MHTPCYHCLVIRYLDRQSNLAFRLVIIVIIVMIYKNITVSQYVRTVNVVRKSEQSFTTV